ncbi:MAG: M23 family metallopeptidase [Elusimicrobia bacterium]|jgi:murein DD-endopeptidase MepM/ murein hydrolase activator NlpD|nr:M23 family metallopeptidase [Elusimicrobiota bacterium]MBK7573877.1 M23 family metallopeptidase [Elusimicrobiota bacterium]MBK7689475.1 M23 family metallopeptidase [Elusimicrobiota bacterium]MBK8126020.1 M23 family metallopeptidase [Elusimicrobiota bacterium]MBK9695090.1 M23 family metallopeptidase [Elusimicrobiota bacterium]
MRFFRIFASASKSLLLAGLLGQAAATARAAGRTPPPFTVEPSTVTAGRTFSVVVKNRRPPPAARLRYDGNAARFYEIAPRTWRALMGVKPTDSGGVRIATVTWRGKHAPIAIVRVVPGNYPVSRIRLAPARDRLYTSGAVGRDAERVAAYYKEPGLTERRWNAAFLTPSTGVITTVFGARRQYGDRPATSPHSGTDIANKAGTPIVAPAAARVVFAEWLESFGHTVLLDHGQGVFTYYIHMKERLVQKGQEVQTAQPIGRMGAEGVATGPHLHWSMVVSGEKVDPFEWTERFVP